MGDIRNASLSGCALGLLINDKWVWLLFRGMNCADQSRWWAGANKEPHVMLCFICRLVPSEYGLRLFVCTTHKHLKSRSRVFHSRLSLRERSATFAERKATMYSATEPRQMTNWCLVSSSESVPSWESLQRW